MKLNECLCQRFVEIIGIKKNKILNEYYNSLYVFNFFNTLFKKSFDVSKLNIPVW